MKKILVAMNLLLFLTVLAPEASAEKKKILPPGTVVTEKGVEDPNIFLSQELARGVVVFPTASSGGGTIIVFDEATGAPIPRSNSQGPFYVERAATFGAKHAFSFGLTFSDLRFDSFNGRDLDGDAFSSTRREIIFGQVRTIHSATDLEMASSATTFFFNASLTPHWDIGIKIPFLDTDWSGVSRTSILETGDTFVTSRFRDRSSGLGDIAVRTKYWLLEEKKGSSPLDLGLGLELRLPTGDEDELLGTGEFDFFPKVFLSRSLTKIISVHGNLGYNISTSSDLDRLELDLGLEFALHEKFTIATELMASERSGSKEYLDSSFGFRWNPYTYSTKKNRVITRFMVGADYVIPILTEDGLRPEPYPTIGLELALVF